jgi:hypothetical protein
MRRCGRGREEKRERRTDDNCLFHFEFSLLNKLIIDISVDLRRYPFVFN